MTVTTTKEYKIQTCCPDKDLAVKDGFIVLVGNLPMILQNGNDLWDMDYCPFCGKEMTTTIVNQGSKNLGSKQIEEME